MGWEWTGNNDIVSYKNWALNEPKSSNGVDDGSKACAMMNVHSASGVWENVNCAEQKWILCNAKEETPRMSTRDLLFPPTWKELRNQKSIIKEEENTERNEKKIEKELASMKHIRQKNQNKQAMDRQVDSDKHKMHDLHQQNRGA